MQVYGGSLRYGSAELKSHCHLHMTGCVCHCERGLEYHALPSLILVVESFVAGATPFVHIFTAGDFLLYSVYPFLMQSDRQPFLVENVHVPVKDLWYKENVLTKVVV